MTTHIRKSASAWVLRKLRYRPSTLTLARVGGWVVFFGVWQLISTYLVEYYILPPPGAVLESIASIFSGGELWPEFGASLTRLGGAFVLLVCLGAPVGLLMGASDWWEDFFRDVVSLLVAIPGLVYVLIVLMIMGLSPWGPVVSAGLATAPYITLQVWEGVKAIPSDLVDMAAAFKVKRALILRHIVIPAIAPYLFSSVTLAFSIGWKVVVLAEVFSTSTGVGFEIKSAFGRFSVADVMAWAAFFFAFALLVDSVILRRISTWFFGWRDLHKTTSAMA